MEVAVVVPTVRLGCAGTITLERFGGNHIRMLTEFTCLAGKRVTVESYITLPIHSNYLNGVAGGGSQSSQ